MPRRPKVSPGEWWIFRPNFLDPSRRKDPMRPRSLRKRPRSPRQPSLIPCRSSQWHSERELAARLEYEMRLKGSEGGWGGQDFIVASGTGAPSLSARPEDRAIKPGETSWSNSEQGIWATSAISPGPFHRCPEKWVWKLTNFSPAQSAAKRSLNPEGCSETTRGERVNEKAGRLRRSFTPQSLDTHRS